MSAQAVWCPEQQIFVGGVVPQDEERVQQLLNDNDGYLRLFGYGSLCWNPGKPGQDLLANPSVTSQLGLAVGYQRCWAQKSADHRGTPSFPGIVCTILQQAEVAQIRQPSPFKEESPTMLTEGKIYLVPPNLVEQCLAELDFREKGVSLEQSYIAVFDSRH